MQDLQAVLHLSESLNHADSGSEPAQSSAPTHSSISPESKPLQTTLLDYIFAPQEEACEAFTQGEKTPSSSDAANQNTDLKSRNIVSQSTSSQINDVASQSKSSQISDAVSQSKSSQISDVASQNNSPQKSAIKLGNNCHGDTKRSDSYQTVPHQVLPIQVSQIIPNPNQPRKSFSEASILKLADSIRQFGIIQPLTVRKSGHLFELIAGERRLRAAKELGWQTVPCIIAEASEEKSAQISIIENLLREDLNIFEQAMAIEALIDTYSLTQEQIAEKLSSSQSYIANKLRLLRFSAEEREKILSNNLTERHARALLRINDKILRSKALEAVIINELNVSSTEELVMSMQDSNTVCEAKSNKKAKTYKDIPSFYTAVSKAIDCAKASNLDIKCRKIVGESFTELTIITPNQATSSEN